MFIIMNAGPPLICVRCESITPPAANNDQVHLN